MKIKGSDYRTIWLKPEAEQIVQIIDQRFLPYEFVIEDLATVDMMCEAIKEMHLRGAGLIGAAAAWGMYLGAIQGLDLELVAKKLKATRPTAVNLAWAVDRILKVINGGSSKNVVTLVKNEAQKISDEDAESCRMIGEHGVAIIEDLAKKKKGEVVNILTHCNAGWLAFVDFGTATAPIYEAHKRGIKVHVWVDETRPRNQGSKLTAFELGEEGIPHTIIADNTGGHLMQHGMVDMVITGTDRTTFTGDVANKIGTYLKALAAKDNNIPFYVALPSSTFDWTLRDGVHGIPIEERSENEVKFLDGLSEAGLQTIRLTPEKSPACNYGFDVTPARLVTGLISERGICEANEQSILRLYPEKRT